MQIRKIVVHFYTLLINFVRQLLQVYKLEPPVKAISNQNPPHHRPLSVNFHFTRKCNYECGFCFHTAKTSHLATLEESKFGLKKLHDAGMKKLNFSGGEPFLFPEHLGKMCKYLKEELQLESVSIVSNGSKIKRSFFVDYGKYVDILAISVDSFDEKTNEKIGRGKGNHLKNFNDIVDWCAEYNVKFKLNTVVNKYNYMEDFSDIIQKLDPCRWKCFQVLAVDTENSGKSAKRNCSEFLITDEQFEEFCRRHEHLPCFVPESNRMMKSSYLILDEYLRFLNKGDQYSESKSILDVSVAEALQYADFEEDIFLARGGVYEWQREPSFENGTAASNGGCSMDPRLEF